MLVPGRLEYWRKLERRHSKWAQMRNLGLDVEVRVKACATKYNIQLLLVLLAGEVPAQSSGILYGEMFELILTTRLLSWSTPDPPPFTCHITSVLSTHFLGWGSAGWLFPVSHWRVSTCLPSKEYILFVIKLMDWGLRKLEAMFLSGIFRPLVYDYNKINWQIDPIIGL